MKKKVYILLLGLLITSFTDAFSQDTSKSLGKINGSVDVSATGGAVYSIPIAVSPGTKGIQPNISLTYNSQAGVGIMGKGWNISGLSAISRSGKTFYHDNKNEKIKFDDTDHFVFDGMTLIPVNGNSGADNTEYRTEIESYVRFFSRGRVGNSPDHFETKMKDGSVVEYGSSSNSRVNISSRTEPLSWNISKITDEFGNYMTFTYINNSTTTGDFLISEINYTGNTSANQLPYNKVVFEYEDYANFVPYYFDGVQYCKTKRLKRVKTYAEGQAEGQLVKTYEITYSTNTSNTLFSVSEIKEINYLGEELNSTKFNWELSNNTNITFQNNAIGISSLYSEKYAQRTDGRVFYGVGDVNGDGFKDIIVVGNDGSGYQNKYYIYLFKNNGDGTFVEIWDRGFNEFTDLTNIMLLDLDYDGKAELLSCKTSSSRIFKYNETTNSFVEKNGLVDNGAIPRNNDNFQGIPSPVSIYQYSFADINGDGILDLIKVDRDTIKYRFGKINSITGNFSQGFFSSKAMNKPFVYPNRLLMSDVNGDGMSDIVTFNTDSVYVYLSNGNGFDDPIGWSDAFVNNNIYFLIEKNDIQLVDINGDGMSDMAGFGQDSLYVYLSTGTSFLRSYTYNFRFPYNSNTPKENPRYYIDLNNDGLLDILVFSVNVFGYINTGNGFELRYVSDRFDGSEDFNAPRLINDFNGDMIPDIMKIGLSMNGLGELGTRIDFGKKRDNIIIDSITDGFNNKIKIDYDFFRRSYRGQSFSYPYTTIFYPLYQVKKINYFSRDIFVNRIGYNFDAPVSYMKGKGFLGFEEVVVTDSVNQTVNTKTFQLDQSAPVLKLTDEVLNAGINSKGIQHFFEVRQIGAQKYFVYEKKEENIYDSYSKSNIHTKWTRDTTNGNITKVEKEIKLNVRAGVVDPNKYTNTVQTIGYVNLGNGWNFKPTYDSTIISNEQNKTDNQITYYQYSNNKLYKEKHHFTNDTLNNEIWYTSYNSYGYPQYIYDKTLNKSRLTRYIYENVGKGRWATQKYDYINRKTLYEYEPKYGNCTKKTDMGGLITNYTYDGWGRLLSTTLPDGEIITNTYIWGYNGSSSVPNSLYSIIKQSNINGKTTTTYDALGRELQIKDETKQITSLSDTRYNQKGQVEKKSLPYKVEGTSDSSKQWTEYTYDRYNRILTEESPLLLNNTYQYNEEGNYTNTVSKTDNIKSVTTTQEYNYLGQVEKSTDNGGDITYTYTATGKPDTITSLNGNTIITYDEAGNRRSITEPNSGTKYSYYNGYGDIIKNVDEKGIVSSYTYEPIGRLSSTIITGTDGNFDQIDNVYETTDIASKGLLKSTIKKLNNISSTAITSSYQYDNLGRISKVTETIDGRNFDKDVTYNTLGQISTLTYPSYDGTNRLVLQNIYNSQGDLRTIKKGDKNLWSREMDNEYGQPLRVILGNNTGTMYYYNDDKQIKKIQSGTLSTDIPSLPIDPGPISLGATTLGITLPELPGLPGSNIQKWVYEYNVKGLMSSRQDSLLMQKETFAYDNLDRLTGINIIKINGTLLSIYSNAITYDNQGNIQTKSDAGTFGYNTNDKPNAIKSINNVRVGRLSPPFFNTISTETLNTTYNSYNKIDKITKGTKELKFYYTSSQERIKTEYKVSNVLQKTTYYIGNYECEVYPNGRIRELNYINTNTGHTIVELKDNNNGTSTDSLYYIFKDHLGSYDRITNQLGQTVEIYSFDAWGNRRKADNWTIKDLSTTKLFNRGFTGHEHLDAFDVINMNGRLYDPVIARFLSPDPYVQMPNNTQNFNRYSYCLNNPLLYTDPSGELFFIDDILIGAAVGCIVNFWIQGFSGNINGTGDALAAMGIGALSGGIGAGVGNAVSLGLGTATTLSSAIGNGIIIGGSGGFAGGFVGGAGSAWANGATFLDGLTAGLITGGIGAVSGALIGGISGGIQYQKQTYIFRKGCNALGIDEDAPVPATDEFLKKSRDIWFPDAPDNNGLFTVEEVSASDQVTMDKYGAAGWTKPIKTINSLGEKMLTGNSDVLFNKNLAFTNAKQLFASIGHELVHVSQISLLANQPASIMTKDFIAMMEYHAYNYQDVLNGDAFYGGHQIDYSQTGVKINDSNILNFDNKFRYDNFSWTRNFKYR